MRLKRNRAGAVLLSVWCVLNAAVALAVTIATLAGRAPPALALILSKDEIQRLDPRALAVVNAQAALANPCIVVVCALVLAIVWNGLMKGASWAWWTLAATLLPLQAFGFVSDGFLGHRNVVANLVSAFILVAALVLARPLSGARAVQRRRWGVTTGTGRHRPAVTASRVPPRNPGP